jgi:predicted transposase YdaD
MQTDKQVFIIFQAVPQWLYLIRNKAAPEKVRLQSVVFKALEKRTDGALIPEDEELEIEIVELQAYDDPLVYSRVGIEMGMIQQQYPNRAVSGLIVFFDRSFDPQTKPWDQIIRAIYLIEVLKDLERQNPDHPLVAVFEPLIIEDREMLVQRAGACYNKIRASTLDDQTKDSLAEVYCSWMYQRLRDKTPEEINAMFQQLPDLPELRESRLGQSLIAIGKAEGKVEGKAEAELSGLVKHVHTLQQILGEPLFDEAALKMLGPAEGDKLLDELQGKIKSRLR